MWFQDCKISGLTGDLVNINLNCNPGMLRGASQILVFIVWFKMLWEICNYSHRAIHLNE